MYDSPEVQRDNEFRSSLAATGLSAGKARYYNPSIGRFISEDPKKDSKPWIYTYTPNNPIAFVDAYGLSCTSKLKQKMSGDNGQGAVDFVVSVLSTCAQNPIKDIVTGSCFIYVNDCPTTGMWPFPEKRQFGGTSPFGGCSIIYNCSWHHHPYHSNNAYELVDTVGHEAYHQKTRPHDDEPTAQQMGNEAVSQWIGLDLDCNCPLCK